MSTIQRPPPTTSHDYTLPGPPSRNNGGSADLRSTGLLAYAAGSSVAIKHNVGYRVQGHQMSRALILYIAAGSLQDALAALRDAQQPDTAAMLITACREIHAEFCETLDTDKEPDSLIKEKLLILPGLNPQNEDVIAVGELYGHFQQKLVHLCMDSQPFVD